MRLTFIGLGRGVGGSTTPFGSVNRTCEGKEQCACTKQLEMLVLFVQSHAPY